MGYAMCFSDCFACHKMFGFNPNTVPSIPIDGDRKPICLECVEKANPMRVKNGLDLIIVREGAYEAIDEREL